jgi:hypothetical protein
VEAARVEAARVEAARVEAARVEAARVEAARVEAARVEAERVEAARVEAARVEAARVEAARVEAARVEAARVEAERRQTIEDVMGFLKGEKFAVLQSHRSRRIESDKHVYEDFSYDEKEKSLEFQMLWETSYYTSEDPNLGFAESNLFNYKICILTASPVISISDFNPPNHFAKLSPPAKVVTITGDHFYRNIVKSEKEKGVIEDARAVLMTEIDLKNLKSKPWKEEKGAIEFVVTEDVAPRLKVALEDLLKSHGLKVPKY